MMHNISRKKAFYIALAAMVAVIIWIFVDLTGNPDGSARVITKEFKDIPIEYLSEDTVLADRGLMLLSDGTDTTADVTIQGTRWYVASVDRDDIMVQANLANITTTGSQSVSNTASFRVRGLSSVVTVTDIKPFTATVNIGELYSRSVDVRCEVVGNIAEGYSAGELTLSPASFEIRGQQSVIDTVRYASVTLDIGTDATATVTQSLDYVFYDAAGQALSSEDIHADPDQIQVTLPVNVTKELKLTMDFVEAPGARLKNVDYTIQPATVTVSGDAEQLKNINELVLSEFDLLSLNSSTLYSYIIPVPEGCENLSGVTQATLQASYKDLTSGEVTTNRFQYTNLPEGKHVTVLTDELTVQIFGTAADVAAVTGETVLVTADLSDFSAAVGSYTVPATVEVESGGDVGVRGTYQIRLTITAAETAPETGEDTPSTEDTTNP